MKSKVCSRCKETKKVGNFNKHPTRKDGLQSNCKACNKAYSKAYYADNREEQRNRLFEINLKARIRNREFILSYLKKHPCAVCGETDPVVLEFDHIRDSKSLCVSRACHRMWGIPRLRKEVEKCQVLCANCHKRKTAKEQGWYRNILGSSSTG